MTLPGQLSEDKALLDVKKAIEAVDKKFRKISDTLYGYKSLRHTIIRRVLIETNDSVFIDPLSFGESLQLQNIVFNYKELNIKVDSISKSLKRVEKIKFYKYLKDNYDNFSMKTKLLNSQPVRIQYIKFPDDRFVHVGIDIYGAHFLWSIDKNLDWDVISVERLWVY